MKLTYIRKELLDKTFKFLQKYGFKKRGNLVVLIEGEFMIYVGFGIVDNDNSFPSTFHYGIASKQINNIKKSIFSNERFKMNDFSTIYGQKQVTLFDNGKYPVLEYDIKSSLDIDFMILSMIKFFESNLCSEIKQLLNLDKLSSLLNSKLTHAESMHLPTTIANAIILSKLTGKPNYEKINPYYLSISQNWAEWDKNDLNRIITFLDSHSAEELLTIANGKDNV